MAPQYTCKVFGYSVQLKTLIRPLSDTSGNVSGSVVAPRYISAQWGWHMINVGLKGLPLHGFTCIKVPDSTQYLNIGCCICLFVALRRIQQPGSYCDK